MHLTIALCTWNRADSLQRTLASFERLRLPPVAVNCVVIDNNCTDHTPAVVAAAALPFAVTRIAEARAGLSNARNAAVAFARAERSDFIVFTDDDVEVEPDWLIAYHAAFHSAPDASVFGGPITPVFTREPAPWMRRNMAAFRGPFVLVDHGVADRRLGLDHDMPFGANMAYRVSALPSVPFDPALGVAPGRRMGGEETDLSRRMLQSGGESWCYVAAARVRHHLPDKAVSPDYLYMHLRSTGQLSARLERQPEQRPTRLPPRWLIRYYVTTWLLRRCWWPVRNLAGSYAHYFSNEAILRGQIDTYTKSRAGSDYAR